MEENNLNLTMEELMHCKFFIKYLKNCSDEEKYIIISLSNKSTEVSLRLLDWFVTSYAKHNQHIKMEDFDDNKTLRAIHINYKAQLKIYGKKFFDPFKRGKIISFNVLYNNKEEIVITTIGQLNFFKWIIESKIFNYVMLNLDVLQNEMSIYKKMEKENKEKKDFIKKNDNNSSITNESSSIYSEESGKYVFIF